MSTEKADNKQSNFANELKNFEKGRKTLEKMYFLNNFGLLFSARKKILDNFKSRLFPIKNLNKIPTREPTPEKAAELATEPTPKVATELTPKQATDATPTKHNKSKLKLQQAFMNEIIVDKKDINNEIVLNYLNIRIHRY